ncbi:MAG: hypothetical protein KatS3mg033_0803 [Thermonema sp.]|nr:MAG: hypothetical protein KatS3mg033_0803 [Thermonema sp.]
MLSNQDIDDLRIALFLDTDPKFAHEVDYLDPPVLMYYDNETDYDDRVLTLMAYEGVRSHALPGTTFYYFLAGAIETKRFKAITPDFLLTMIDELTLPGGEADIIFQKHSDFIEIGKMVTNR